ncbi:MAG: ABC transporter permease [Rhizomicrobium sp.]
MDASRAVSASDAKEGFVSIISILSLVGIALGVAALIIVMAVMNGFRHDLLGRILGLKGHLMVQGVSGSLPDFDQIVKQVRGVSGVTRAAPLIEGQVMATSSGLSLGVLVQGMRAADLKNMKVVSSSLTPNALNAYKNEADTVIIGEGLAEKLRLATGMTITLIAPRGNVTPRSASRRGSKPTASPERSRSACRSYDSSYLFMPLDEAQLYFNMGATVSGIEGDGRRSRQGGLVRQSGWQGGGSVCAHLHMGRYQFLFLRCDSGRAQRDVPDFIADRGGGVAQHHLRPHHAGERQEPGHCHPAHDGRHAWRDDARLHDRRRKASVWSERPPASRSALHSVPTSRLSVRACRSSRARPCSIPRSISSNACLRAWRPTKWRRW